MSEWNYAKIHAQHMESALYYIDDCETQGVGQVSFLLVNRPLSWLLSGQLLSLLGDYLYGVALGWIVISLESSSPGLSLAIVGLCMSVPRILFGTFVGPFVDRWNKKIVLICSDLFRGVVLLTLFAMLQLEIQSHAAIYGATLLLTMASIFFGPANRSFLPQIVKQQDLERGNSFLSIAESSASIIGLSFSGLLIGFMGSTSIVLINAISFFASAICISFIQIQHQEEKSVAEVQEKKAGYWEQLREGFQEVRRNSLLLFVCLFAVVLNIGASPLNVLEPLLVRDVLHEGPVVLGFFGVAVMLGSMVMGLLLARLGQTAGKGIVFLLAGIAQGLAVFTLGVSSMLPLSLAALFLAGMTFAAVNVPFFSILQKQVPQHMIGRVVAIVVTASNAATPLATFACGLLVDYVEVSTVFVLGGLLSMSTGVFLFLFKRLDRDVPHSVHHNG